MSETPAEEQSEAQGQAEPASPDTGKAVPVEPASEEPAAASTEPEREELPKSVSYGVIGAVLVALCGYAVYTAMNPGPIPELPGGHEGPIAAPVPTGPSFGLEPSLVDKASIVRGGPPRDGVPALVDPKYVSAEASGLKDNLRVVGVAINEDARAYPVGIMNYHEVVNDTIGGKKVAVTFCPLCDLARTFDREIDGEVIEFGVSGLLRNANMLLFDRRESVDKESLWSQIEARAITGAQAGKGAELVDLGAELTTWGLWRTAHPQSQVLSPKTGHEFDYKKNPYAAYFASDRVDFPVDGRTKRNPKAKNKSHVVVVRSDDKARAYSYKALKSVGGELVDQLGDARFTLRYNGKTVTVEGPESLNSFNAYWFAVDVLGTDVELWDGKVPSLEAPTGEAVAESGEPAPAAPTGAP